MCFKHTFHSIFFSSSNVAINYKVGASLCSSNTSSTQSFSSPQTFLSITIEGSRTDIIEHKLYTYLRPNLEQLRKTVVCWCLVFFQAQNAAASLEKKQKKIDQEIAQWKAKVDEVQAELDASQRESRANSTEVRTLLLIRYLYIEPGVRTSVIWLVRKVKSRSRKFTPNNSADHKLFPCYFFHTPVSNPDIQYITQI